MCHVKTKDAVLPFIAPPKLTVNNQISWSWCRVVCCLEVESTQVLICLEVVAMHNLSLLDAGIEEPSPMAHKPHIVLQSKHELVAFVLLHEGNLVKVQPKQAWTQKPSVSVVLQNSCCHLWILTQYAIMRLNDLLPLPSVSL